MAGMGGLQPISWGELHQWNIGTQTGLNGYELEIIRRLSQVYVNATNKAKSPNCPPPFVAITIDREKVSDKVGSMFRSASKRLNGGGK